jgi:hypothetical protein
LPHLPGHCRGNHARPVIITDDPAIGHLASLAKGAEDPPGLLAMLAEVVRIIRRAIA